jgi:hypothetical protein
MWHQFASTGACRTNGQYPGIPYRDGERGREYHMVLASEFIF